MLMDARYKVRGGICSAEDGIWKTGWRVFPNLLHLWTEISIDAVCRVSSGLS